MGSTGQGRTVDRSHGLECLVGLEAAGTSGHCPVLALRRQRLPVGSHCHGRLWLVVAVLGLALGSVRLVSEYVVIGQADYLAHDKQAPALQRRKCLQTECCHSVAEERPNK